VYDLSTGEVLWEDALLGGRTTYQVFPIGETLLVYSEEDVSSEGYEEQVIRKYDSHSGFLRGIDRINIPEKNSSLLLKTPDFDYWTDGKSLWSINNEASQEQWKIKIDNQVEYDPLLIDSKLIFASGIFSDVICVDDTSGRQIWNYRDKIVSDLTTKQGIIYAIRTDAAIVGMDSKTGKEVGYIGIEPRLTETSSRSHAYLISVTEDMLFVYYGDSQELIALSK
jgi:outer membrane protein assembly factor BamB